MDVDETLEASPALVPAPVAAPPVTGQGVIDQALAGLAALDEADVAEHPARLARAHEILRATLHGAPIDDLRDEGA